MMNVFSSTVIAVFPLCFTVIVPNLSFSFTARDYSFNIQSRDPTYSFNLGFILSKDLPSLFMTIHVGFTLSFTGGFTLRLAVCNYTFNIHSKDLPYGFLMMTLGSLMPNSNFGFTVCDFQFSIHSEYSLYGFILMTLSSMMPNLDFGFTVCDFQFSIHSKGSLYGFILVLA